MESSPLTSTEPEKQAPLDVSGVEALTKQDREAILFNAHAPPLRGIDAIMPLALDRYEVTVLRLEANVRALRAALQEAQKALSPFYAYACLEDDLSSGHSAPDEIPVVETTRNNIHAAVTVGDFRRVRQVRERAAAVLAQGKDE